MSEVTDVELAAAAAALGQGGVVGHPTETLYGLGVDPAQPEALRRLAALKGERAGKGYIVLVADPAQLAGLVIVPPLAARLIERCWPGPLTLVLPARPHLADDLTGGTGCLGVRWSPHPTVAQLLTRWGGPMVSTSANRAGQPPLPDGAAVRRAWGARVAAILPGAAAPAAQPSTVLKIGASGEMTWLRTGALAQGEIEALAARWG